MNKHERENFTDVKMTQQLHFLKLTDSLIFPSQFFCPTGKDCIILNCVCRFVSKLNLGVFFCKLHYFGFMKIMPVVPDENVTANKVIEDHETSVCLKYPVIYSFRADLS